MTLALLLTAAMSTTYGDDGAKSNGLFSEVEGEPPPSAGVETIASRLVRIDFQQLDRATKPPDVAEHATTDPPAEPPPSQELLLNLFDDVVFTGIVQHVEPTSAGYALWGGLEGVDLGTMTIVVNGSVVAGTVRTPQTVYTIRTLGDDVHVIRQIDESTLLPLGEPQSQSPAPDSRPRPVSEQRDDGQEIDVMVVYTRTAKHQQGGRAGVEALIDLMVAETNQAYANSRVNQRIRLVLREEVDYVEDGDSYIDLGRLGDREDGFMDEVHRLRNLYAADLVHMLVGTSFNVGGVAQLLYQRDDGTYGDSAFGLTVGNDSVGLIFSHELGHNMGLRHDRYQALREERTDSIDGYNYGYVNQRMFRTGAPGSARWRTIMAYRGQCTDYGDENNLEDFYCQRILSFSNPELTYNGDPLGVPVSHPSRGADGPAHAARTLNENRQVVANFRQSSTSTPKVALALSPYWLVENGGSSTVTAFLNRPASADTTVTVSVSRPDAVTLSANRTLTIPASRTASVGFVTLAGIDNGNRTGDVFVTVSGETRGDGVAGPDPAELAIADDETTPVVTLSLSPAEVLETPDPPGVYPVHRTSITATLDHRSGTRTKLTVSASPDEAVEVQRRWDREERVLIIPAGQTTSNEPIWYQAVDDNVFTRARKSVTVSATASNQRGVTGPESVTLTILDGDAPIFAEDKVGYSFTAGVSGARFLPKAGYGNGRLTYSISPAPGDGVTFTPGPPARMEVPATSAVSGPTNYTLTATDAQGDTDTMTVTVTVRPPVCSNSAAVSGYAGTGAVADCEALLASAYALSGDGKLNWSERRSMGRWEGVHIRDNRVVTVVLAKGDLNGSIPSELGSLADLTGLRLYGNQLSGALPPELGNLGNLELLVISENRLTHEIPESLGNLTNLRVLSAWGNRLTGLIPHSLTNLTNLERLWLSRNQFTGCIPAALRNVPENDLHSLRLPFCDELPPCPEDCQLLLGVMDILVGDSDAQLNWNDALPLNDWTGVEVNSEQRVTTLDLHSSQLSGMIPTELGNLATLERLYLWGNELTGPVPAELGNLANLEILNLRSNQLAGTIPAQLGNLTNLQELYLYDNELTGTIPPELGNLANLRVLDLADNQLTEPIPVWLGDLTDLEQLYLWGNQLTGLIPTELGGLTKLEELYLSDNQLTGPIPPELGNLANLTELSLRGNQLTGEMPPELGSLTNLERLILNENQLSGEIPPELGSLANLERLYLWGNELTGETPSWLGSLSNLEVLSLSRNQLTGEVPSELGNLANLKELVLSENQLSGEIPPELGSLANLERLYLWGNELTGETPSWLGSLSNLEVLSLSRNQLTGEVPSELGNLANLKELVLSENQLSGEIPPELGSLANLERLYLWGNELTGEIPSWLGSLSNLEVLSLSRNQLTGEVPSELGNLANLKELVLSENQLSGEIPPELGSLANLERLYLWGNELTGPVPSDLGRLTNLGVLSLGTNRLSGTIPAQLGSPANLTHLSLNHNQLSGQIPEELGNLTNLTGLFLNGNQLTGEIPAELGNLTNLQALDLSINQLSEQIPADLGDLTNLNKLSLNSNRLSGEIPEELGNLTNLESVYLSNNQLIGCIPRSLKRVTNNDLAGLGLHFCDMFGPGSVVGDRDALVALYNATDGASWANNSGWLTDVPMGQWHGVETANTGRVTGLILEANQLSGEIPDGLGALTNLATLNLGSNRLRGEIPAGLGNLTNLTELHVSFNQLSGTIPAGLGNLTNLKSLQLVGNLLSGGIPAGLGNLTNLTELNLWSNRLSGEIPVELGSLTNLTGFDLSENPISGEIPAELGNLTNLRSLRFKGNQLSGEIPPELSNLTSLEALFLSHNRLTGRIPEELGSLSNLAGLFLNHNQLGGDIPGELGGLTNLTGLYLHNNQLGGEIPADLGSLTNLKELRLSGNQLTGCIPNGLRGIETNDLSQLGLPFCDMPGAPTIDTPIVPGDASLTVAWTAPINTGSSAITAYDLRYIETGAADKSDANWTVVEDVWAAGSGSLQYTLSGLTGGTQYDVQVRAVNAAGASAWSAAVTGTTAGTDGDPLFVRYDTNRNGIIEKSEVIEAINDYLFGEGDEAISKSDVIKLINLYLFG